MRENYEVSIINWDKLQACAMRGISAPEWLSKFFPNGIICGTYLAMTGANKAGKTHEGYRIGNHIADQGVPVYLIDTEQSREEIKIALGRAGVPLDKMKVVELGVVTDAFELEQIICLLPEESFVIVDTLKFIGVGQSSVSQQLPRRILSAAQEEKSFTGNPWDHPTLGKVWIECFTEVIQDLVQTEDSLYLCPNCGKSPVSMPGYLQYHFAHDLPCREWLMEKARTKALELPKEGDPG